MALQLVLPRKAVVPAVGAPDDVAGKRLLERTVPGFGVSHQIFVVRESRVAIFFDTKIFSRTMIVFSFMFFLFLPLPPSKCS